jgi:WhiB family transcriptional regulator, redox-sensing transcriptional regulator
MTAPAWVTLAACAGTDPDLFFPLTEDALPGDWAGLALCAESDPEAWFPEKGGSSRQAKAICARCEVRAECLAYAMEHGITSGVWGGMSENERRLEKRRRRERAQRNVA